MKCSQQRSRAFSLIELLVVIGIIAILLSILLPVALSVRRAARSARCLANLQQWGSSFQAYSSSYGGKSLAVGDIPFRATDGMPLMWWELLRPNDTAQKALLCPEATEPGDAVPLGPFNAWGPERLWTSTTTFRGPYIGSYGFNAWLYAHKPGEELPGAIHLPAKDSANIPLFFDCARLDLLPTTTDPPLLFKQGAKVSIGGMSGVAMRRHNQGVNIVFLDNHAESIPAERLWTLKWSQDFAPHPVTFPN